MKIKTLFHSVGCAVLLLSIPLFTRGAHWTPWTTATGSSPVTLASDNFNRSNASPMAGNWTASGSFSNSLNLSANTVLDPNNSDDASSVWNALVWPNDQWSEVEVTCEETTIGAGMGYGPAVRCASGSQNRYFVTVNHATSLNVNLFKIFSGAGSNLAQWTVSYVAGGKLRLSVTGTVLTVSYNGSVLGTFSDSSITSGSAGIYASTPVLGTDFLDNWAGGTP